MRAVVTHTKTALSRQRAEFKDRPQVVERIAHIESELQEQLDRLELRLKELGGSPTSPVRLPALMANKIRHRIRQFAALAPKRNAKRWS